MDPSFHLLLDGAQTSGALRTWSCREGVRRCGTCHSTSQLPLIKGRSLSERRRRTRKSLNERPYQRLNAIIKAFLWSDIRWTNYVISINELTSCRQSGMVSPHRYLYWKSKRSLMYWGLSFCRLNFLLSFWLNPAIANQIRYLKFKIETSLNWSLLYNFNIPMEETKGDPPSDGHAG